MLLRSSRTLAILLLCALSIFSALAQYSSIDEDVWVPDSVVKKEDPWIWISGENDMTEEEWHPYHWNADHWELLGRQPATCDGCTRNGKDVYVDTENLKLFVNDEEFIVKAMCYNPAPLGEQDMDRNTGFGGTGLCSARLDPFGDWKSACYDSDYWDGTIMTDRDPPGPAFGWFNRLWKRDFPYIKELGSNTVRIYNANPSTRAYTQKALAGEIDDDEVTEPTGKYHIPFLDYAEEQGLMVIFPLLGDENLLINLDEDMYKQYLRAQIDEVGTHPSILMFTVGNELGLGDKPELLAKVNLYMNYARDYLFETYDRRIPFTHALVDNPPDYDALSTELEVDIMSTNAGYRGLDLSDLWDGNDIFRGWRVLSQETGKPVFISEIGWHQLNGEQTENLPGWFNQIWQDLLAHVDDGAIGGAFFEYNDEPLKADDDQQTMGAVRFEVNVVDEVTSTTGLPPADGGDGSDGSDGGDGSDGSDPSDDEGSASRLTSFLF